MMTGLSTPINLNYIFSFTLKTLSQDNKQYILEGLAVTHFSYFLASFFVTLPLLFFCKTTPTTILSLYFRKPTRSPYARASSTLCPLVYLQPTAKGPLARMGHVVLLVNQTIFLANPR